MPRSSTKNIAVRHHFIRDHLEKRNISLSLVPTNKHLANIFTKPLSVDHFAYIRMELRMLNDNA